MSNLLLQLVKAIVATMVAMLSPEQVKSILDSAFDKIEDKVKDSSTQWDDVLILPVLAALRSALGIPDNDPEPESESDAT